MVAVNELGRPIADHAEQAINRSQSTDRKACDREAAYRSHAQIRRPPARADQLAWKIAEVAADPVAVETDVVEMIGNRIIDNAAVARPRWRGGRWPARGRKPRRIRSSRGHRVRLAASAARVAGMGGMGQRRRGARTRLPRHVPRGRLFASRRQHSADARGRAALRADGRRPRPRPRHRLRNPGRSREGHLPARAQDRSHRPSRPVGRRRHRHAARACRPRRSIRRCNRRCMSPPPRGNRARARSRAGRPMRRPSPARWRSKPSTA